MATIPLPSVLATTPPPSSLSLTPISSLPPATTPAPPATPQEIDGLAWTDTFDIINFNGLASSKDIIAAQDRLNAEKAAQAKKDLDAKIQRAANGSVIDSFSLKYGLPNISEIVSDMSEAIVGILGDFTVGTDRSKMSEILLYKNRLRGLGAIIVMVALIGIAIDFLMNQPANPGLVPGIPGIPGTSSLASLIKM